MLRSLRGSHARTDLAARPPADDCTITCRRNADYVRTSRRLEEEHRDARERRAAEETDRSAAERRRNLRAGGTRRLEQLQSDASDANRCGWFEAGDDGVCQRRVTRAYLAWCREHTDREEKLEEEALEAEIEAFEAEEDGSGTKQRHRRRASTRVG